MKVPLSSSLIWARSLINGINGKRNFPWLSRSTVRCSALKISYHKNHSWTAVKCNPDPVILRLLAFLGCSFDCATMGEIGSLPPLSLISPNISGCPLLRPRAEWTRRWLSTAQGLCSYFHCVRQPRQNDSCKFTMEKCTVLCYGYFLLIWRCWSSLSAAECEWQCSMERMNCTRLRRCQTTEKIIFSCYSVSPLTTELLYADSRRNLDGATDTIIPLFIFLYYLCPFLAL